MFIDKENEEQRSRVWQYVFNIATVVILVIAIYFVVDGFFGNPIKGSWQHDESDMILEIQGKDQAVLEWNDLFEGQKLRVELNYSIDMPNKQITFKVTPDKLDQAVESLDGIDKEKVESAISMVITTFNYSLDGGELSLIEWDYGEQLLFSKCK